MASRRLPPIPPRVFAPEVSHPMIDDFTLRALRHQAKQVPGTMPVFPLPLRNHPIWSANNEIGRQEEFAPDANNRQMIIKLGEWGEPAVWTTMLGIQYNPDLLSATSFFDVVAEVQAGIGGTTQQFEVDWTEGTMFSCPCNSLIVTAKYGVVAGITPTLDVPDDLVLRASIGRKPLANASPPTRSFLTEAIPAGTASAAILIPKFARRVTPMASFGLSAPYLATTNYIWQNNPSIPSSIGSFTGLEFITGFGANGIPVPPDARAILVSNLSGIATRVRLMFHLAL